MNILVLGGEGMLGHKMFQTLLRAFPQTTATLFKPKTNAAYSRIELYREGRILDAVNAMELNALDRLLAREQPAAIINCIGMIKQRGDATKPIPTITLNSLLPHRLAASAAAWGGKVIHFSTDCVFSGRRGSYAESDESDATDLYGKSKFLGEVRDPNALTLRTSIIGRELFNNKSLLEWFLAQRGGRIHGYTRVMYSGITTNYLSALVLRILQNRPDLSGLYQVTSQTISKYDLLLLLRSAFGVDVSVERDDTVVSDRSLDGKRFLEETGWPTPSWPQLTADLAADTTPYSEWKTKSNEA
jgi:dTDP-4-dehydrorhamnose reductase